MRQPERPSEPLRGTPAKGAAAGMVVGGMSTRHNRREERRSKR